jgi:glycine/D-amino acid oxidase-like deaminating enzyme
MGCATALDLADGGMRVAVVERRGLCMEASGVNAGTLSIQIKRAALVPYALRGWELWRTLSKRLGVDVNFHIRGGVTVAFTEEEAELLKSRMGDRRDAGAPIEIVDAPRARAIEPALSDRIVLASYCPIDGYSNPSVIGLAYRTALLRAGVVVHERAEVTSLARDGAAFAVQAGGTILRGRRLVLAGGAWLGRLAAMLGVSLPVAWRINQVSVTERSPFFVRAMVGHATGLLTLKQADNGTVLIGGGWQGEGDPNDGRSALVPEHLIGNLRLARCTVPALAGTRLVRTWHGFEAHAPDFMPLVGPLTAAGDVFVIGCVRGGYTIGPYMGQLLAQAILGQEPERPLFDPCRFA